MMPALFKEFLEPDLYTGSITAYEEYGRPELFEEQHQIPWIDPTAFNAAAVTGAENFRKLYAAGVSLGCGNDGGIPFIFPGALPLEMRLMEKSGMTTTDVLRIATFGNASIINMAEKLGSIEEGKIADLAVYEKNPLETVVNLEHPLLVFHDGELAYKIPNSAYIHTTAQ
jgi:imidazolonepropionase-like amidohydrolase